MFSIGKKRFLNQLKLLNYSKSKYGKLLTLVKALNKNMKYLMHHTSRNENTSSASLYSAMMS